MHVALPSQSTSQAKPSGQVMVWLEQAPLPLQSTWHTLLPSQPPVHTAGHTPPGGIGCSPHIATLPPLPPALPEAPLPPLPPAVVVEPPDDAVVLPPADVLDELAATS
jgi:hypothetical protein